MRNPTGGKIRNDPMGSGYYGSPRGNSIHKGIDHECKVGQPVGSPIEGVVKREARPYAKGEYSGVLIKGARISVKMFYLKPLEGIVGRHVKEGDMVGNAQDITKKKKKYREGGMKPHIHTEIDHCDPLIFLEMP